MRWQTPCSSAQNVRVHPTRVVRDGHGMTSLSHASSALGQPSYELDLRSSLVRAVHDALQDGVDQGWLVDPGNQLQDLGVIWRASERNIKPYAHPLTPI